MWIFARRLDGGTERIVVENSYVTVLKKGDLPARYSFYHLYTVQNVSSIFKVAKKGKKNSAIFKDIDYQSHFHQAPENSYVVRGMPDGCIYKYLKSRKK